MATRAVAADRGTAPSDGARRGTRARVIQVCITRRIWATVSDRRGDRVAAGGLAMIWSVRGILVDRASRLVRWLIGPVCPIHVSWMEAVWVNPSELALHLLS